MEDEDNVVEFPKQKELKLGSNVKIKSGGPTMTVSAIRTLYLCTYLNPDNNEFCSYDFLEHEIEIDTSKK